MITKPNILYIHSHDTGRYVQPYGYQVDTPNIQKLAEEGVLFRKAFSAAPTCSPSRGALLTGQSPHANGVYGLAKPCNFELNDYDHHLIHTLKKAGYISALSGIQHVAPEVEQIGYDKILALKGDAVVNNAVEFLGEKQNNPFFLSVGFAETHRPFPKPNSEDVKYCLPPATMPDTVEVREDMAGYHISAKILDQKIGIILEALKSNNLDKNTIVICTTDHGLSFPEMKSSLTDHGIGVMMILRGPMGLSGGKVIDGMVSQMDLFPTLCEMLELDKPEWLEGKSILPLINGQEVEINEVIFAESNYHDAHEPQRCVRTQRYKYIKRFDQRTKPVLPNCDDCGSKDYWVENGWQEKNICEEYLFDLIFDPNENCNLIDEPSFRSVADELRDHLGQHLQETSDGILNGPLPMPTNSITADPDGISALTGEMVRAWKCSTTSSC